MFGKVFASLVIIVVLYTFGVFFAPVVTDTIGEKLGIMNVNTTIRQLKVGVDSTSETLLQIQSASGTINSARDAVNKTLETVENSKKLLDQKVQQGERVLDSVNKARDSITELQNNVSELTTFSGSVAASGSVTGSGR